MKSNIKKTRFNEFLLIKVIDSYTQFKKDLWWNEFDYYFFEKSATQEINAIMYKNKSIIRKDAIRLLYQPNDVVIYDEPKCIII
jgi:hypothetical protein